MSGKNEMKAAVLKRSIRGRVDGRTIGYSAGSIVTGSPVDIDHLIGKGKAVANKGRVPETARELVPGLITARPSDIEARDKAEKEAEKAQKKSVGESVGHVTQPSKADSEASKPKRKKAAAKK